MLSDLGTWSIGSFIQVFVSVSPMALRLLCVCQLSLIFSYTQMKEECSVGYITS